MFLKLLKNFPLVFLSRYFLLKKPLFVGFALTNKCNLRCHYCNIYSLQEKELSFKQVASIIGELAELGCLRIAFTGGEPLLRKDFGKIIELCNKYKISTSVSTNGYHASSMLNALKKVDCVNLSIDGPPKIHDLLRGAGSFAQAVAMLDLLKKNKIKRVITTVITPANMDKLDYLIELANEYDTPIKFQVVSTINVTKNNFGSCALSDFRRQRAVLFLKKMKKRSKYIANSWSGLAAMETGNLKNCVAGKIFFRITAGGDLMSCWRQLNNKSSSILKYGLKEALHRLESPKCNNCYLTEGIELTLSSRLHLDTIWILFRNNFLIKK